MKKLLGILVLGLLLGGLTTPVAYTKEKKIKIKVRMQDSAAIVFVRFAGGKEEKKKRATVLMNEMAKSHCSSYNKEAYVFKSHGAYDQDALHKAMSTQWRYFCAKSVDEALRLFEEKKFDKYHFVREIDPVTHYEVNGSEEISIKESAITSKDMKKIEGYKETCAALGFELGTDKFTDCTLKLFDADNKETTQIVQSSSGAQEIIIRDPDRERRIGTKAFSDFVNGKCQINLLSKNPCQF